MRNKDKKITSKVDGKVRFPPVGWGKRAEAQAWMNETGRLISTVSSLAVVAESIGDSPTVVALLYALGRDFSLIGTSRPPVAVSMEVGVSPSLSSRRTLSSP